MKKLDPSGFKGSGESGQGLGPGLGSASLKVRNRLFRDSRVPYESFLRPVEEGAGGAALRGGEGH